MDSTQNYDHLQSEGSEVVHTGVNSSLSPSVNTLPCVRLIRPQGKANLCTSLRLGDSVALTVYLGTQSERADAQGGRL